MIIMKSNIVPYGNNHIVEYMIMMNSDIVLCGVDNIEE